MLWRLHIVSQRILHPRPIAHARSMTATAATNAPKSMKAKKRVPASSSEADDPPADKAKPAKKRAKPAKKGPKPPALPSTPVGTRYEVSMRPEKKPGKSLTIMSWNVAGLRALVKKDAEAIKRLVNLEQVDVLCLQEHKLQEKHVTEIEEQVLPDGWAACWSCSVKLGYSGTCILYRKDAFGGAEPSLKCGIGYEKHDDEGRTVTMSLPGFHICNAYVPNAGTDLQRLDYRTQEWDVDFTKYLGELRRDRPVILTGDLNCAREPIDIHNAKGNVKSAGFTPEERESFQKVYMEAGWRDTFRDQHPDVHGYTYYSYRFNMRAKGRGWRLDYFLVSPDMAGKCHDSFILPDFFGSDHCPLGLTIDQGQ